jgi:hypothetical protein
VPWAEITETCTCTCNEYIGPQWLSEYIGPQWLENSKHDQDCSSILFETHLPPMARRVHVTLQETGKHFNLSLAQAARSNCQTNCDESCKAPHTPKREGRQWAGQGAKNIGYVFLGSHAQNNESASATPGCLKPALCGDDGFGQGSPFKRT